MKIASLIRPLGPGAVVMAIWGCQNDDYDNRDDLTTEVISCENAIQRLEECCPGFVPSRDGQCIDEDIQHKGGGCIYDDYDSLSKTRRLPEMTLAESRCVRQLACEDIVQKGICDRVKRNGLRGSESYDYDDHIDPEDNEHSSTTYPHEAVCP